MGDWPKKLRIRATGLRDDIGGAGQHIFTTAGQGYEKQDYFHHSEIERLTEQIDWHQQECVLRDITIDRLTAKVDDLRSELMTAYDLVAEAIADKQFYDFNARAQSFVNKHTRTPNERKD